MVDYAAFVDTKWHDTVLWVQRMLESYTMTELWGMEIVRFMKLVQKSAHIQAQRMKEQSLSR